MRKLENKIVEFEEKTEANRSPIEEEERL